MRISTLLATTLVMLPIAGTAHAAGELNIYNWGDYTSPEMIKKFEEKYDVKVTITDYDSNDTALAKVKAGAHGFDMVVPSAQFIPIWVADGLSSSIQADTTPCPGSGASPESQSIPTPIREPSTAGA
jgi:spermidine/putrescine transport system substrate-binding protein